MITLEQVEKLKERANVSYEDAKAALEITDGDLLEAVIYLEKQGKIQSPYMRSFNTQTGGTHGGPDLYHHGGKWKRGYGYPGQEQYEHGYYQQKEHRFREKMGVLWRKFCVLLRKANMNHFVVSREGLVIINMPVTLLIIAAVFFFWVTIPLLVIGLFCDCRYKFQGPDLGRDAINNIMEQAAYTAESIKRSVTAESGEEQEHQEGHQEE
jgi:hypothetical protein